VDGRALQVHVVSAQPSDGGANDVPDHPVHLCHCSHTHAQVMSGAGERVSPFELRGCGFPRHAPGLGRLPEAPPARPPAVA
jgi:hypothetical protein